MRNAIVSATSMPIAPPPPPARSIISSLAKLARPEDFHEVDVFDIDDDSKPLFVLAPDVHACMRLICRKQHRSLESILGALLGRLVRKGALSPGQVN